MVCFIIFVPRDFPPQKGTGFLRMEDGYYYVSEQITSPHEQKRSTFTSREAAEIALENMRSSLSQFGHKFTGVAL